MDNKTKEELRKEYLEEIENVVACITLEHLQQLFKMGNERIAKDNAPQSQIEKMKEFRFELPAINFLTFMEICLLGESKYE